MATNPGFITGEAISATKDGAPLRVSKSSITCEVKVLTKTNSASGGAQEVSPGIKKFSGSLTLEEKADAPTTVNEGDYIDVAIGVTGGRIVTGPAMVKSVKDDVDVEGDYKMMIDIESSGAFTVTVG